MPLHSWKSVLVGSAVTALSLGTAAAQEAAPQTVTAFKTTVSYAYSCNRDVFTVAIGAANQVAEGGETALYWEISDSGQTASGGVQNIAMLNTLAVQAVGSAPQANGVPAGSVATRVYRSCTGQSLYVWAASSATRLVNGDIVVYFANAVEQPLQRP
jgi:hypothetical protein